MAKHLGRVMSLASLLTLVLSVRAATAEDTMLFDFEDEAAIKAWSNIDVFALRQAEAKDAYDGIAKAATNPATVPAYKALATQPAEPAVKIERVTEGATSGKGALKLTFAGGHMPTIATKPPVDDWRKAKAFCADVTASRTCMVVFRAMAETSKYGTSYNDGVSRWEFAARLEAGKNSVVAPAPAYANVLWKGVKSFEIYMYEPQDGESITIDNIRLSSDKPAKISPFTDNPAIAAVVPAGKFKVLGTDLEVRDVDELADKCKDAWAKPEDKTVDQIEGDIKTAYENIKKDHPKAVLAMLREGQKGLDAANPDKAFAGWEDSGTPSHLPMSLTLCSFHNSGKSESIETCFRNRPGFLRVDLSSIPKGAEVLSAKLVVVRSADMGKNWETKPTMFVAEPCNRPWKETEVSVFEYAKGKLWGEYAGMTWGDDADCAPVFVAHGPAAGKCLTLDFTQAVKYWADGKHANQGFILYGAGKYVDYLNIFTRENGKIENRPCLAVIYEAK